MNRLKQILEGGVSRRSFLAGIGASAGTAAAATLAVGCGSSDKNQLAPNPTPIPAPASFVDADYLNFALNLEYLEAEFYLRATTGAGLSAADTGASPGDVTGGSMVNFVTPAIKAYALEIAADELAHVRLLRGALGAGAVARPTINFTDAFNAAAAAAGISGGTFNPFDNENDFILGAFVFEDVGVTAYNGAGPLLTDKTGNLNTAAGIVATEAYHAGEIRTILAYLGGNYLTIANQISDLRAKASSAPSGGIAGETHVSPSTIVAADANSLAYARSVDSVMHIVYLNGSAGVTQKGGFFPSGLNGTINTTQS